MKFYLHKNNEIENIKIQKKKYFGTNCLFAVFFSFYSPFIITYSPFIITYSPFIITYSPFLITYSPFLITYSPFSGQNASLLVLKDFRPSRA